jgi:hypothetical protein
MGILGDIANIGMSIFGKVQGDKLANKQMDVAREQITEAEEWKKKSDAAKTAYKTPKQIKEIEARARMRANKATGYLDSMQELVGRRTADAARTAERTATSGAQALAAINNVQESGMDKMSEAVLTETQLRDQRNAELNQAQQNAAAHKDKEWSYKDRDYLQGLQFYSQLKGSGQQNKLNALGQKINNATQMGANIAQSANNAENNIIGKLLGIV